MYNRRFVDSFNAAIEGFVYTLKSERNMRIHFLAGFLFILLGIYLNFSHIEMVALCITIALVLASEMINTAIELTVDMVKNEFHPIARIIKDIAAGTVLITSLNAAIVGYILLARRIPFNIAVTMANVRSSPWHITFIALISVLAFSIIGKVLLHKGTPLRGGMPSGHASVAFAIWTVIAFLTNNVIVIALSFLMAALIARHRIKDSIHTFPEVLAGSLLGVLLTTIIFQLLR